MESKVSLFGILHGSLSLSDEEVNGESIKHGNHFQEQYYTEFSHFGYDWKPYQLRDTPCFVFFLFAESVSDKCRLTNVHFLGNHNGDVTIINTCIFWERKLEAGRNSRARKKYHLYYTQLL